MGDFHLWVGRESDTCVCESCVGDVDHVGSLEFSFDRCQVVPRLRYHNFGKVLRRPLGHAGLLGADREGRVRTLKVSVASTPERHVPNPEPVDVVEQPLGHPAPSPQPTADALEFTALRARDVKDGSHVRAQPTGSSESDALRPCATQDARSMARFS